MSQVMTTPLVVDYKDKPRCDGFKIMSICSLIMGSIGVIFGIVNLILTLVSIGYQSEYDILLTELQGIKNDLDRYNMTERFKQGWLNSAMMFQGNFTKEQIEQGRKGLMNAANWLKDKDSDQMEQINGFLEGGIEMVEQMSEEEMDELVNMLQFNYLQYSAMKEMTEDMTEEEKAETIAGGYAASVQTYQLMKDMSEEEAEEILNTLPKVLQYNFVQYGIFKALEQAMSEGKTPAQVEEQMMATVATSTMMQTIVSYALLSEMEEMSEEEANQFITTVATQFVSFLTGEGFDVMQEFRDTIDGKEEEAASDAVAQAFQDGLAQMVQAICSISKTECSDEDIQKGIEGLADVLVSMFGGYNENEEE